VLVKLLIQCPRIVDGDESIATWKNNVYMHKHKYPGLHIVEHSLISVHDKILCAVEWYNIIVTGHWSINSQWLK
jgi:hypothetical protein